jgi:hypothetical protein
MKKQIIAAAVAATMTSVAFADVSITGSTLVNYTYTDKDDNTSSNAVKNETDIVIVGKNGDTSVTASIAMDDGNEISSTDGTTEDTASSLKLENVYLTTKVGDVNLQVGDWDNGDNALRASSRKKNKITASTTVGGIGIKVDTGTNGVMGSTTLSTTVGGIAVSYKDNATNSSSETKVSGSFAGINAAYHLMAGTGSANDKSMIELAMDLGDASVKIGRLEADANAQITGESWFGDYEEATGAMALDNGQDVTAMEIATSVAGNAVVFRHAQIDDGSSSTDTSFNKVIVTRPLANGTTFELTYTDTDDDAGTSTSSSVIDLELAVKF